MDVRSIDDRIVNVSSKIMVTAFITLTGFIYFAITVLLAIIGG